MHVMQSIKDKVKAHHKRIVLSEGMDKRMIQAAVQAASEGFADPRPPERHLPRRGCS